MRGFFAKSVSICRFYEPLPLGKPLSFFVSTGGFCRIYLDTYMYGFGEEIPRYALALYDYVLSVEEYLKYGKLKP